MELSVTGKGMLKERAITELPLIDWCRMVRMASKLSFIQLHTLNDSPITLVAQRLSIKPKGDFKKNRSIK